MRYYKIFFVLIFTSFVFLQETKDTETDPAPAIDPNAVEEKVESIKNLLLNPCEGLNEEDCGKAEGCEYNAEEKVCSQSEAAPAVETTSTEDPAPIDFKDEYIVNINLGCAAPIGANLRGKFTPGPNFKIGIITPFGLSLQNSKILVSGNLDMMSLAAASGAVYDNFTIMSFGAKLVLKSKSFDVFGGLGLSTSSGTPLEGGEASSMTTAHMTVGGAYNLPLSSLFEKIEMKSSGFDPSLIMVSIYTEGIEIFGAPAASGTSDLFSFGLTIGYPLLF